MNNFFKENKTRGFLFTISVVFFASTLLIYAQMFSSNTSIHEKGISSSDKFFAQPFANDDLAFDLLRINGLSIDLNKSDTLGITLSGVVSPEYDLSQMLLDYNSFINNTFLSTGSELDMENLLDGDVEVNFGNEFVLVNDYDKNNFSFTSSGETLNLVDLNINYSGSDMNNITYPSPEPSGSSTFNLNYIDDTIVISKSYTFDPTVSNVIRIEYNDDSNIEIVFGLTSASNSLLIDSNSRNKLSFDLMLNYSYSASNLEVYFPAVLHYARQGIDSNSFLKLKN